MAHENFDGVLFVADTVTAFYEAVKRAKERKGVQIRMDDALRARFIDFSHEVEDWVNHYIQEEEEWQKKK